MKKMHAILALSLVLASWMAAPATCTVSYVVLEATIAISASLNATRIRLVSAASNHSSSAATSCAPSVIEISPPW